MGYERMEFDILVAGEISDRIREQTEESKSKSSPQKAVAKRNQKREQRKESISSNEMGDIIKKWVG